MTTAAQAMQLRGRLTVGSAGPRRAIHRSTACAAFAEPTRSAATSAQPPLASEDQGHGWTQDELDNYLASYKSQPIERSFVVDDSMIDGEVPRDLEGTLLRNGPGNYEIGEATINHAFDGDGLVCSYAFKDGKVIYRRAFVRTASLLQETAAGKLLSKGAFTVGDPSGKWQWPTDLRVRQPANTGVVDWAGKILALHEADLPYVLDDRLRTEGRSGFGAWQGDDVVAAHYRVTMETDGTKRLVTFGGSVKGSDNVVKFVELREDGMKACELTVRLPNAAFGFCHDVLVTDNYYVLLENSMKLDLLKLIFQYVPGKACIAECIVFDHKKSPRLHCIPRPGKAGYERPAYMLPPLFTFHHIQAFEADSDTIICDTMARGYVSFGGTFENQKAPYVGKENKTQPTRIVVKGTEKKARVYNMGDLAPSLGRDMEFPSPLPASHCGKPYSLFFAGATRRMPDDQYGYAQCVAKVSIPATNGTNGTFDPSTVDATYYYAGDRRYVQEPCFVPRKNAQSEDDGYILVNVQDLRGSDEDWQTCLEILDAQDIGAGPIATIRPGDRCPIGFHGWWTDRFMGALSNETLPYENNIRVNL